MIRKGTDEDFEEIFTIINDAAMAYKEVIPTDRWHEPYMTKEELQAQIGDGVRFSCYVDNLSTGQKLDNFIPGNQIEMLEVRH